MAEGQLQLSHVELYTPVLQKSLDFFTKLLGMSIVHEEEESVYLRGYEDTGLYSLILTQHETSGLGHSSFRTSSQEAIDEFVEKIEADGVTGEWIGESFGHGKAYRFLDKDGHTLEIFAEIEKFKAPDTYDSRLPNRPQRRPLRGVPVRRLDHINYMTNVSNVNDNVRFFRDVLGFKLNEYINVPDSDDIFAAWLSVSNLVHEIAMIGDNQDGNGRLHHVAFWYGIPQHLDDIADLCADWGIPIEIGPIKHGLSQALCMYVIEPGGNRIELFGDSGYLIFDNDFEPVEWTFDQLPAALNWFGGDEYKTPPTYLTYGTPPIYSGDPEIDVYNELRENRLGQENYDVKIKFDNKETVEN